MSQLHGVSPQICKGKQTTPDIAIGPLGHFTRKVQMRTCEVAVKMSDHQNNELPSRQFIPCLAAALELFIYFESRD